jgi:hypothetical protein
MPERYQNADSSGLSGVRLQTRRLTERSAREPREAVMQNRAAEKERLKAAVERAGPALALLPLKMRR